MTLLAPAARIAGCFFPKVTGGTPLLRNKTRKCFAINNGVENENSHAEELSLWTRDEASERQILRAIPNDGGPLNDWLGSSCQDRWMFLASRDRRYAGARLLRNKTRKSFAANDGLRTKHVILRSFTLDARRRISPSLPGEILRAIPNDGGPQNDSWRQHRHRWLFLSHVTGGTPEPDSE